VVYEDFFSAEESRFIPKGLRDLFGSWVFFLAG